MHTQPETRTGLAADLWARWLGCVARVIPDHAWLSARCDQRAEAIGVLGLQGLLNALLQEVICQKGLHKLRPSGHVGDLDVDCNRGRA